MTSQRLQVVGCPKDVYGHPCQRDADHDGPCINHFQMRKLDEPVGALPCFVRWDAA
jgi:hypothetical protein